MTKNLDCRLKTNKSKKKFINKKSKKSKKLKKSKQQYFFNPNNPKLSFDVYINKNHGTIPIKYTLEDVNNTIKKLERLFKKQEYTHKEFGNSNDYESSFRCNKKNSPHIKI